jgi:hypothetical protein
MIIIIFILYKLSIELSAHYFMPTVSPAPIKRIICIIPQTDNGIRNRLLGCNDSPYDFLELFPAIVPIFGVNQKVCKVNIHYGNPIVEHTLL